MRTIKIGEVEYQQLETAEDLSVERYAILKEYILYKETGVDTPSLSRTITGFVHGFDNESKAHMLTTLYDFLIGTNRAVEKVDADQLVFSLITLEEGEDVNSTNEGFLKEKLKRMNANGLTQSVVEETVENFISSSSTHFVTFFLQNMRAMREMSEL